MQYIVSDKGNFNVAYADQKNLFKFISKNVKMYKIKVCMSVGPG